MAKPFEFVIFSDLHAHNFKYAADRKAIPGLMGLYNSRLADTALVLDEIIDYCKVNGITTAVFCGDLFHRRTSVTTDVRCVIIDRLHKFVDEDIQLHMIPGNHDMGDRHGYIHNLVGVGELSEHIHVYSRVGFVDFDQAQFVFIPYRENLSDAKKDLASAGELAETTDKPSILFGHQGIKGAVVGSDYVLINDSDITVPDIPGDKFAACFFGHFHQHQQLSANAWYVGATHQHNWGDVGGSRGFLHVKVDENVTFSQIETQAPKFVVVREADKKPRKKDFVKLITDASFADREELKKEWGLDHLEIVFETKDEETEFSLDSTQLSPSAVLQEWVDKKAPQELDKDLLLAMGREILKEVGL